MVLAQEVDQDCKYGEQYLLRQSLAQLQPRLTYAPEATSADQLSDFPDSTGMPQSMMVSDARVVAAPKLTTVKASHYMQTQSYALQRVELEDVKPTTAAPATPTSSILTYPSGQHWGGVSAIPFNWDHAIQQTQPCIVPNSDLQFGVNHRLNYNHTSTAQNNIGKGFGDQMPWPSLDPNALPREMDTSISPSPKSYLSDDFDNTYSPVSMLDQSSPCGNWKAYPAAAHDAALPSPVCQPYLAQDANGNIRYSGLPRMSAHTAMASVPCTYSSRRDQVPMASFEDDQQSGSEHSRSQTSSTGDSPWFGPGYSYNTTNVPFRTRDVATYSTSASDASFSSTDEARPAQHQSTPWDVSRPSGHAESRIQDRFQIPRSAGAQAQREHNDRLLIDGKKMGETYKEIKMKMVGEKPAESTLRGRYRSLTKARKDRVRKPIWTKTDVSRQRRRYFGEAH
jgi:hypothetical protein